MEQPSPPPAAVAPPPKSKLKSGLLVVLKLLYWPAAFLLAMVVVGFVENFAGHDRRYQLVTAAVAVISIALLSAMTILRFKPHSMKAPVITAHALLLLLGVFGARLASRVYPHASQVASAGSSPSSSPSTAASAADAQADADRAFWTYRMDTCRPLVQDAQEVRHQETMLLIIESAIIKDHNLHGNESSQAKAASARKTIFEARSVALRLRSKFKSEKFGDVQPDWFADTLRKYASTQANYAFITAERARILKEYGESGDTNLLVGLEKVNKELSDNSDNALQFEKGFAAICFSPPDKRH